MDKEMEEFIMPDGLKEETLRLINLQDKKIKVEIYEEKL